MRLLFSIASRQDPLESLLLEEDVRLGALMDTPNLSAILGLAPPPGVTPNFVDPDTREHLPKITAYVTLPPMVLLLVLRFYTRLKFTALGVDDSTGIDLCGLAAAAIVANTALSFAVCGHPAGPHQWDIPVDKFTLDYAKFELAISYTYFIAAIFIKVSILVFYRRIFGFARYANWLIWIGISSTVILYAVIIIFLAGFCLPHHEDYASGGILSPQSIERCLGVSGWATFVTGIVSVVIDAYILAIPLGFLTQLNTSRKRRASLCALFTVGFSALAVSIVGAVYRSRFLFGDLDSSWSSMYVYATQALLGALQTLGLDQQRTLSQTLVSEIYTTCNRKKCAGEFLLREDYRTAHTLMKPAGNSAYSLIVIEANYITMEERGYQLPELQTHRANSHLNRDS
ncbi:hypothetical protein NPX13_g9228 [Xylaria arbuscula]|uniref:Rhodopsin domain-containing protein n=1 Tax=Xylaria arbuscula TaxID=114810 RepID=A0A9W8N789_9PEZI|nr:hypothetical protein NPX13_g9228 [Xylaria arbuscula]